MTGIVVTLIVYQVLMLGIGWWASRRNTDSTDFYLGGRTNTAPVPYWITK